MSSSLISNSHHVDFDSVFGMDDASITQMFELLIATGLKDFLGCPVVYYEAVLIEFSENGSVREDGMVVSTIRGINVEISDGMFATEFGLPTEGLTDVSEVPKDLVFDARSLFSESEEQTLFVKAGSFDAVTRERFMLMTAITFDVKINWGSMLFGVLKAMVTPGSRQPKGYAIQICVVLSKVPGLELGESNPFPIHILLTERIVHRYIHINEHIGMEKASGSTPVKKTVKKPVSKKRSVASETEVAPISKKKRTTKGKPAAMALEAVPLQTIEPTADVPSELPPVPKIKSRKRRLVLEQEDDLVVDEPVEESATGVQETSTDVPDSEEKPVADPDDIIEQILIQLDTAAATQGDNTETWFDRAFDKEFATSEQEKQDSEEEIVFDVAKTDEEASSSKHHPEELMSLDVRDKVMVDVVEFFHSFSLNKLHDPESLKILKEKEILMLEWAGTDSLETAVKRRLYILAKYREMLLRKFLESHQKYLVPGQPWTATASQIIDILSVAHSKSLEVLVSQQKENGLPIEQPCTSAYLDTSIGSGAVLAQFFSQAKSKCWVRPMVKIDGLWTLIQGPEFLRSSCKLSLFVNKRPVPDSVVEEDFVPHGCVIEPFQYWGTAPSVVKTWGWARVCTDIVRYHMFGCLRSACKEIVVYNLGVERIPYYLLDDFEQGVHTDTFVGFFRSSPIQSSPEIDSDSSDGSTVYRSPSSPADSSALGPVVFTDAQEEGLYSVEFPDSPLPTDQIHVSTSSSSGSPVHFDSADIHLDSAADAQTSLPTATVDLPSLLDDLKSSLSQRMDDANSEILSRLHSTERSLQTSLGHQNDYLRSLIQSARQEGQTQDVQMLRLNELKKAVLAQGVSAETNSLADRSRFNAIDAKFLLLDGQIAAIRNDQLEFQSKIAADILSLSTQIGDIADYIRGGDAKKGEIGSSSRRPPPVRVERRPLPTQANQDESSSGHGRVLSVEEAAEMVREADRWERERKREKSLRRLRRRGLVSVNLLVWNADLYLLRLTKMKAVQDMDVFSVWKRLRKWFERQIDGKEKGKGKRV
ncbi:hypothetical protein F511_16526 [Dorcoceras hygrometricum]|uniref:Dystroglycan-like n=1 Tax=Dorcoceras hygrometricum TaxID=472368 RepID=A0A2Z7BDB7_9LAMI|nr:hypothetical protein F511_16526 [Dorcoceras hygrometricum]